jgi:DNA-binding transcriptional LysR family regulator
MNITLRQLYGFKAAADVGTFTAAAHRLKVAQPPLSLNIRDGHRRPDDVEKPIT